LISCFFFDLAFSPSIDLYCWFSDQAFNQSNPSIESNRSIDRIELVYQWLVGSLTDWRWIDDHRWICPSINSWWMTPLIGSLHWWWITPSFDSSIDWWSFGPSINRWWIDDHRWVCPMIDLWWMTPLIGSIHHSIHRLDRINPSMIIWPIDWLRMNQWSLMNLSTSIRDEWLHRLIEDESMVTDEYVHQSIHDEWLHQSIEDESMIIDEFVHRSIDDEWLHWSDRPIDQESLHCLIHQWWITPLFDPSMRNRAINWPMMNDSINRCFSMIRHSVDPSMMNRSVNMLVDSLIHDEFVQRSIHDERLHW
jgi:hypothetical protein